MRHSCALQRWTRTLTLHARTHAYVRLSESAMCDVIAAYTAGDAGSGKSADGRQPMETTIFVHFVHHNTFLLSLSILYIPISHFLPCSLTLCLMSWTRGRIKDTAWQTLLNTRSRSWRLANSSGEMKGAIHTNRQVNFANARSLSSLRNLYTRIIFVVIEREIAFPPLKSGSLSLSGSTILLIYNVQAHDFRIMSQVCQV